MRSTTRSRPQAKMFRLCTRMLAVLALVAGPVRAESDGAGSVTVLPRNTSPAAAGVRPIVVADVAPAPYTDVGAQSAPQPAAAKDAAAPPATGDAPAKAASSAPQVTTEDNDPRALTAFRSRLDPYGAWVEDEKYGTVWVPNRAIVGEQFAPYVSSGRWALDTGNNWVWVSDFAFGDVVFHYGRWVWTAYGWAWIPGYQYAPAWVTWRTPTANYHYVGWAPAPPSYVWFGGYARPWGYPWSYYWVFCPSAFLFAPYPYGYIVTHPLYIRSIARYTRVYTPAEPRLRGNPSLESARVPREVWPADRIAAGPGAARTVDTAARPGVSPDRLNGATRIAPAGRQVVPPGRLSDRAGPTPFAPPARPVPSRALDGTRQALPPGRLVPPSRFDAPSRPFAPGSAAFRDAPVFPQGRTFDTARPIAPSRFDTPARSYSPGHVYNPAPGPSFAPHRFDSPSRGFSPSFDSSPSFSPRSYSPPPMREAPAPRMSPPPMRSPRGN